MRLLVLGGTAFVGRAIVEDAVRTGAEVTLFGRGKTGTGLFPGLARLMGDRDSGDYAALRDGSWDAVVDVSGYVPRHVGQAMDALGDRVGRYLFISSHAVYRREGVEPGSTEDTPRRPPRRDTEMLDEETYGPLKVACEDDVAARYGSRATIVRPGKVAGPHDWQDGLTYWVRRAARGGRVGVPGDPEQPVQVIDSVTWPAWWCGSLADDRPGAFQAVGPAEPITLGGLIETCARAAGTRGRDRAGDARRRGTVAVPADPDQLGVAAAQRGQGPGGGHAATALEVTAADTLAWDRERGEPPLARGYTPEEEAAVLAEHDSRSRRA